jgi:hypothetical protein
MNSFRTDIFTDTSAAALGFASDEDGAGTVFGLFLFMVIVILGGAALDGSNAWRNATHLSASADAAAHAGAVALANGGAIGDVRTMAEAAATANMPEVTYGAVVGDAIENIQLMHFDTDTRILTAGGTANAVVVDLGQTRGNTNAVRTYFLRLMGVDSWDVTGRSIAVYDATAECSNVDGIFAEDEVSLSSQNSVGSGFCVHSQEAVWLPQQNSFGPGSVVSMPNLADCKSKCDDASNPGINPMAINMILPDFRDYILDTYDAFNASSSTLKTTWFNAKSLGIGSWNLHVKPLKDIGVKNTTFLGQGSVVTLTWDQFHALPSLPSGLVYNVDCPNNGNSSKTKLTFNGTTGVMEDAAIITDCSIEFGDGARVLGSLVVTIREQSTATVTSGSSVTVADPTQQCHNGDRTTVMSLGKVSVPAEFVMSNVTLVVDDDVNVASATSSGIVSRGLSIYSSGKVSLSSQHTLEVCGGSNLLAPEGKVIRHVMAAAEL